MSGGNPGGGDPAAARAAEASRSKLLADLEALGTQVDEAMPEDVVLLSRARYLVLCNAAFMVFALLHQAGATNIIDLNLLYRAAQAISVEAEQNGPYK